MIDMIPLCFGTMQAGKLIPRGGGAKECLVIHDGEKGSPKTPDTIQRFRSEFIIKPCLVWIF